MRLRTRVGMPLDVLRSRAAGRDRARDGDRDGDRLLDGGLLADLSHELRTPLASILGYAELLTTDAGELDPDTERMLHAIRRNAGRMTEVLDNLATLADIRRGDFVPGPDPVDLVELLDGLPGRLSAPLAQREVGLELSHPTWLPAVSGDGRRLQQAFVDLTLGVADRCAAGSSVSVAAAVRPGTVLLTISTDTCTGARGQGGVGLTVARAVVGEHGGRVRSASTGLGATTVVRLPSLPEVRLVRSRTGTRSGRARRRS